MERKRHIRLVNGLSRVQEGSMKARGRKDVIPHITLSCYSMFPGWMPSEPSPRTVGFPFFRRRGPVEDLLEINEAK